MGQQSTGGLIVRSFGELNVCTLAADTGFPRTVRCARGIGQRHRQLLLLSLGLALGYCCRINLSICIVATTSKEAANGYPVCRSDRPAR